MLFSWEGNCWVNDYVTCRLTAKIPGLALNPTLINQILDYSKCYHYLLTEINWLLIFFINSYTQPAVFIIFSLLKGTTLKWQN